MRQVDFIEGSQLPEVVDLAVHQEHDSPILLVEAIRLIGLEGLVHDGETMESNPAVVKRLEAGVVRASFLDVPERR